MITKDQINIRLKEFRDIYRNGNDKDIFLELVFCILTPQSKAKTCWEAALSLKEKNLLFSEDAENISRIINSVRFKNKKARFIILAKKTFMIDGEFALKKTINGFSSNLEAREWLVKYIKGIGLKEASHFLRNIGLGENLAILDRHILKNLKLFEVIEEYPKNLSIKKYLEIEDKMIEFSRRIRIDMETLDFILWYKEAKEVFK